MGIGAAKCATTWTYHVLGTHPDVRLPERKELNFWSRLNTLTFEWYANAVADHEPEVVMGDISPGYLRLPQRSIVVLRARYPDVRIFLNVRHPVDRVWSRAKHLIREQRLVLAEMSEAELEPFVFQPNSVDASDYATHLERWLSVFPAEQILVSRFEQIIGDPHVYFARLCEHIGIDDEPLRIDHRREPRSAAKALERPLPAQFSARLYELLDEPMMRFRDRFGIDYT